MKLFETRKLHYNTYLYKLSIRNQLAYIFRTEFQHGGLQYAQKKLDIINTHSNPRSKEIMLPQRYGPFDKIQTTDFWDAITIYRDLKKATDYKIRCEMGNLIIYSNNRKMLVKLANKLRHSYVEFWEPNPENITILTADQNVILSKKKPKYEYMVTLGNKTGSPTLSKWITANPKLAKMGDKAKDYCASGHYVKGLYFYVRDQKTLMIAQMLVGDNIQRIDKYVFAE